MCVSRRDKGRDSRRTRRVALDKSDIVSHKRERVRVAGSRLGDVERSRRIANGTAGWYRLPKLKRVAIKDVGFEDDATKRGRL